MKGLARGLAALGLAAALAGCGPHGQAKQNLDEGMAFLKKTAKEPGVVTLPDGLEYKVVRSGPADGPRPRPGDEVKVSYEGTLLSGDVFDSTYARGQPAVLKLKGLIPGWMEALQKMRPGDEWILYVPPKLGYGDQPSAEIPADSVLVFKIELLGVLPTGENTRLAALRSIHEPIPSSAHEGR